MQSFPFCDSPFLCAGYLLLLFETAGVKARVKGVEILAVEPVGQQPQVLAEPLIMHDLARSEEADRVDHVGVVAETQDIVIRRPRLLFGGKTLVKVGDRVALGSNRERVERHSRRRYGIDARRVIDKVGVKAGFLDILLAEIPRELIYDRADHFEVVQFLRSP